jgi:acetyl esterase/lipase
MSISTPLRAPGAAVGLRASLALVIALVCSSCLMLPPGDPGPLRFRDEVFQNVTLTSNVTYGTAVRQDGTTMTLQADVYRPSGDTAALRPLIVWVHGGSFKSGSKTSGEIVDQANVFARKGYVNASINYRLSAQGCTVVNAACVESIVDATEDAQAAIRFFRQNAATYGIDPSRIAISGTSAGAITAMNVGFRAEVPGSAGATVSSEVKAAVSFSGARLIGSCDAGDAPALMFHGTADPLVPYTWATNTVDCARNGGVPLHLETWEGEGHVPYAAHRAQIIDLTTTFLFNALDVRPLI